jgi:hypothetical protein
MNDRGHLTSETIDLLVLASLAQTECDQAKAHLAACPACKARLTELEADKQRFEQYVLPRTLAAVEARASAPSFLERLGAGWKVLVPVTSLAVAATVALTVTSRTQTEDEAYIGVKGGSALLEVVAQRGEQRQFAVKEGTLLRPKDKIRFVVNPGAARFVLIASRDGRGNVTIYYPFDGQKSAELRPGRQELPGSIELDEVAGRERLLAVFSEAPLQAAEVRAALEKGPAVATVPGAKSQVSWEFVKEAP